MNGPWRVVVACDGETQEDAEANVRELLAEANETTFGYEPVFLLGEYPTVAPERSDSRTT